MKNNVMNRRIYLILLSVVIWVVFMMIFSYNRYSGDIPVCVYISAIVSGLLFGCFMIWSTHTQIKSTLKNRPDDIEEDIQELNPGEEVQQYNVMNYLRWKFLSYNGVGVLLKDKFLFILYEMGRHHILFDIPFSEIASISELKAKKRFTIFLKSGEKKYFKIDGDMFYYEFKQLLFESNKRQKS